MSMTQTITEERRDEIVEDSIGRQLKTVLTHRLPGGWHTYKSSFVSGNRFSGTIVLSVQLPEDAPGDTLPEPGDSLGITFRLGHKKCMFNAVMQSAIDDDGDLLLTVGWPGTLEQLQRRVYQRAAPPQGAVVAVRFWPEEPGSHASQETRNVRHGQLEDLSAGGMRLKTGDLTDIEVGLTYRCTFAPQPGAAPIVVDAVLRHHEATDRGRASLGFHFSGLEATPEGRKLLDRIARTVTQFHRSRNRKRGSRPARTDT